MRTQTIPHTNPKHRKGFSIMEVAIAILVVTVLLTTFLGVFAPAQKNIARALSVKEVNRLSSALENELGVLRDGEEANFDSSFDKAYQWIANSPNPAKAVVVYQYNAAKEDDDSDGILPGVLQDGTKVAGVHYTSQTVARRLGDDDAILQDHLRPGVIDGALYVVRFVQLVKDSTDGSLIVNSSPQTGKLADPDDSSNSFDDAATYPKAQVAVKAEFYKLRSNQYSALTNGFDFTKMGKPIAVINLGVRR